MHHTQGKNMSKNWVKLQKKEDWSRTNPKMGKFSLKPISLSVTPYRFYNHLKFLFVGVSKCEFLRIQPSASPSFTLSCVLSDLYRRTFLEKKPYNRDLGS